MQQQATPLAQQKLHTKPNCVGLFLATASLAHRWVCPVYGLVDGVPQDVGQVGAVGSLEVVGPADVGGHVALQGVGSGSRARSKMRDSGHRGACS